MNASFEKAWKIFCEETRGSGLCNIIVSQDFDIIAEEHRDEDLPRNVYSVTKSFTSTAVGIAQDEGILSIEENVIDCFPDEIPDTPSPFLEKLKIKHLISMTLGQGQECLNRDIFPDYNTKNWAQYALSKPFVHEPGTAFLYNNAGPYLAGLLIQRRTGETLTSYLYDRLFRHMNMRRISWQADPNGNNFGPSGLLLDTRQLLTFGEIYLNHGMRNGEQIIPASWVDCAQIPFIPGEEKDGNPYGYGYGFWMGPHKSYRADGFYGQFSIIMNDKNAVAAVTAYSKAPRLFLEPFWNIIYPEL